jgi:ethanolamine ammonia-lyase large subunit
VAARWCLAEVPLADLVARPLIPYEDDDVTRRHRLLGAFRREAGEAVAGPRRARLRHQLGQAGEDPMEIRITRADGAPEAGPRTTDAISTEEPAPNAGAA